MTSNPYSDENLAELGSMPKKVTNPGAHWLEKPGHRQRNFQVSGQQDEVVRFSMYQRQNTVDEQDFSCGIAFIPQGGSRLTLARYNGPSHRHRDIAYRPHIHGATARAIAAGKKPESEANETDRFSTLNGALRCMIKDLNLKGLRPPPLEPKRLL